MGYLFLAGAIVLEVAGTICMKYSNGFSKLIPAIGCIISYSISFFLLSKALQTMNLGIVYATWAAVGIVATTIISFLLFKEGISVLGILGIILMVAGVILLNLFGKVSAG
jgi:small multidrug resistance pump